MKKNKEYHQESYLPALDVIDLCCFTAIGWQPAVAARDLIWQTENEAAEKEESAEPLLWVKINSIETRKPI